MRGRKTLWISRVGQSVSRLIRLESRLWTPKKTQRVIGTIQLDFFLLTSKHSNRKPKIGFLPIGRTVLEVVLSYQTGDRIGRIHLLAGTLENWILFLNF